MKVATWNVNGIRARSAQVLEFAQREAPDVLCLQEIKAGKEQVPEELLKLPGYLGYWHGHKGYSGVALLLRREAFERPPLFEHPPFDHETRIVTARLNSSAGELLFASIYVPNGGKDFAAKMRFLEAMNEFARAEQAKGTRLFLCGDLNVAREERDVHPSLRNGDQIGQTPAERALLEQILAHGLVDLSRQFRPEDDRLFTWWAPWRNSRARDIGWRLDYQLVSSALAAKATSCEAHREIGTSDHGPVVSTFDLPRPERGMPEPEPAEPAKPAPAAGPDEPDAAQLKLL